MNILGKRPHQEEETTVKNYEIPAILRNDDERISLKTALIFSFLAHPILAFLVKLLIVLLAILGINLVLFDKPAPKMRDIEFVLVNQPEQKPLHQTKFRADRNTRAGGKHDPRKMISPPEPMSARSRPDRASAPASPAPRLPRVVRKQSSSSKSQAVDTPIPPRPVPQQAMPRPIMPRPNAFSIPVPHGKMPKAITPSGGPVTKAPIGGDSSPSSSPAPVMGTGGTGTSAGGARGRSNGGYSHGGGNLGNPGPGNPHGSPGIDAVREPDFGPYMRELQRRIKRNWDPPRGNESKRVVLLFKVSRDGRLLSLRVYNSSGNPEADRAAMSAVQLSAPFRQLPPEYRGNDIDIQFTFDYNVFNASRIK